MISSPRVRLRAFDGSEGVNSCGVTMVRHWRGVWKAPAGHRRRWARQNVPLQTPFSLETCSTQTILVIILSPPVRKLRVRVRVRVRKDQHQAQGRAKRHCVSAQFAVSASHMQRGNLAAPPQTHEQRVHLAQGGTQMCVISLESRCQHWGRGASCDVETGHIWWSAEGLPGALTSGRGPRMRGIVTCELLLDTQQLNHQTNLGCDGFGHACSYQHHINHC